VPFLIALVIGVPATFLARRVGMALGLVDRPGDPLRIHPEAVPLLGGPAVVAASLGATAALGGFLPGWLVVGILGLLALGVLDDRRPVSPLLRLALQTASGVALAAGFGWSTLGVQGAILVPLLTLACANAVNMLDGQDGLAGGLGAIAALGLVALLLLADAEEIARLGLALAGALAAFLLWNRPPASIFLGDGGAYAIGGLLGALAGGMWLQEGWRGLLAAGFCLGVMAFELIFTIAKRLGSRRPLTAGDRSHSYDLLSHAVGGRTRSTAVFLGIGAALSGLGIGLSRLALIPVALVGASALVLAAAAGLRARAGGTLGA
jgi:UDP-GlcNAc:undecaprenyl-phosphate GlcNAc-1-phosphate transferase